MRYTLSICLLLISNSLYSQSMPDPVTTQSSSDVKWETISNDHVKLIYPTFIKGESLYLANLIEHYSQYVGQTWGIKSPKQFPLIIRPELAEPNGFVTLAPRRSEWFSSSSFSSYVGTSEWYQTLAIHEYRHVNQFDYFRQSTVKVLSYLTGDFGEFLSVFLGLQPWILEGDAVWAETKYTDAGRGRSPLFLARLKALVLSNRIPTYDEFVNGTYNNSLPNHYVFGYALVSHGYQKYGEDFWSKIFTDVAKFPHPFRLYESFYKITGQNFEVFYDETMNDLKTRWAKDTVEGAVIGKFRENTYPHKLGPDTYSLNNTLDSHWEIQKNGETIVEIPFIKDLNQIHMAHDLAVYTQFLPHSRYAYKGSSDIVLVDLKTKKTARITKGLRLYSPRLNQEGTRILATEFSHQNKWFLSEFDLTGKKIRTVTFTNLNVLEAAYLNNDEVIAIMSDARGYKFIAKVNFEGKNSQSLLAPTRNNIFALNIDPNKNIFFEGQYKGAVNIFKMDLAGDTSMCGTSKLANQAPFSDGQTIYFSQLDTNGSKISQIPVSDCQAISKDSLVNFNYLSDDPSDNFNKFPIQKFDDQVALRSANSEKYSPEPYGDFSKELLIPHSWGFIGGKGIQLSAQSSNYLNTMGLSLLYAAHGDDNANRTEFSFDIRKWYPLISINAGVLERKSEYFFNTNYKEWEESFVGASVLLPYTSQINLYTLNASLGAAAGYLDTREYAFNSSAQKDEKPVFTKTSTFLNASISKQKTAREIFPKWGLSYSANYDNAESNKAGTSSYRFTHSAVAVTPGFTLNHAFRFTGSQEKQRDTANAYHFLPALATPIENIFSRGYDYKFVSDYQKVTGNYIFPIVDPDYAIGSLAYIKRVTANVFFDSTHIDYLGAGRTLNSTGLELEFVSKIARILPVNVGARYVHRLRDSANIGELYFALDFGFAEVDSKF